MTKKQLIRRRTERKEPLWYLDPATGEVRWGILERGKELFGAGFPEEVEGHE